MLNLLSHKEIAALPSKDRAYKLFDGGGLYVEVVPTGSKYLRLKYRFDGKDRTLSLGVFPRTSLKDARTDRDEARRLLSRGIDPNAARAARKATVRAVDEDGFEVIAREWFAKRRAGWVP